MRRALSTALLLLAILAALFLAGRMNRDLLSLREEYGFTRAHPLENTPPLVAFTTVALGGFRGLVVDALWMRAARLQEEGRYFELVQLATWITELEPRLGSVWVYHAWNMAYNISVLFEDPVDRWRWVRNGISLLRDRGLFYNPGDPELYHQLGWIFQHKIGDILDQAHWHYKRAWAAEMTDLLGGPAPDYAALRAEPDGPRARRMIDEYKLLPDVMEKVDAEYGPLDWRLPDAHAIYWAWRGKPSAEGFDAVQLDRMIFQNLSIAFRRGRLYTSAEADVFIPSPNLDLLPRVRKAYEDAIARHPDQETYKTGHANFLREAVLFLYSYNRVGEARELFDDLAKRYPSAEFEQGFEPFVRKLAAAQLADLSAREAGLMIQSALVQSYLWLGLGEDERATGYEQLARDSWDGFMEQLTSPELLERNALPPLADLKRAALEQVQEMLTNRAARTRLEEL
ncbi:MAG: hypothetical protein JXB04_07215 [Kiritimatiellae bacterium]|nr:hypothetical protein [Kiritimatiellia bacterium]